jgi:hypothetical protein
MHIYIPQESSNISISFRIYVICILMKTNLMLAIAARRSRRRYASRLQHRVVVDITHAVEQLTRNLLLMRYQQEKETVVDFYLLGVIS